MKTAFNTINKLPISILLLSLSLTIACSKKKKDNPEPPTCRIITVNGGGATFNIDYNADNKITKVTSGSRINTYQYDGNTVIVHTTNSGTFHTKKTYTLNSNGFVTNKRTEFDEAGTDWDNSEFLYNGGTQVIKTTITNSSGDIPTIYTHLWDNGNMIPAGSSAHEYYTDKPQQPGDFFFFQELLEHDGMKVYGSKNALKSVTVGSTQVLITYAADQDGKITSMTVQRGTLADIANYQYQCD